ncbi:hypothetical protein SAMN05660845_2293 [Flavobacterium swingsii]|uniref:Uncharacterized protein n=1 Tax=Flavobacterium swingsii TaxID=498292 RepID=A0A1I0ZQN7_9FLAO|nr:hypothetical protein [Flavobacterium swingsii]SFB26678.1 hypothetical protein SAMN05660845_2293 [Flavobacterium swingsii]
MTYDMLGLFSFSKVNADDFEICFEIPDNCFYVLTPSATSYKIDIKLNPGETQPSTTFVGCKETVPILNNKLIANFEQYKYSGVILKKPSGTFAL